MQNIKQTQYSRNVSRNEIYLQNCLVNACMKKFSYILFALVVFFSSSLFALEVDIDEMKEMKKIQFHNYVGKHKKVNLLREIKGIGRYLAKGIKKKGAHKFVNYSKKYSMLHAVSGKETNKMSADIFSIKKKASVGHIKNVRRILAGYLEDMYDYSKKNAHTLSVFITYYNAVYRGDMGYFSSKYKEDVVQYFNRDFAGISTNYKEWPAGTKVIIPLTKESKRGQLDGIDLDVISDEKVKEIVRKDDTVIDERKDLVEIKEEIIDKEKQEIEQKKAELENEKEEVEKIEDEAEREKREEEIEKKEEAIGIEEEIIEEKEEKLEEEKREIREDELGKKEKDLDKREDIIRAEKVDKNIYATMLYYLKVKKYQGDGHYINDMYLIDAETLQIKAKSPVKNIAGSKYDVFSDGVVVITHKGDIQGAHRLTLLDRKTLKAKAYGKYSIFWRSFVIVKDDSVYAIMKAGADYYLGKFDSKLERVARSTEKIHGDTFISFYENKIFINRWDYNVLVLNTEDLSLIDVLEPGVQ